MKFSILFAAMALLGIASLASAQQTLVTNAEGPAEFSSAAQAAGYQVTAGDGHWPASADVAVIETDSNWGHPPVDRNSTVDEQHKDGAAQKLWDAQILSMLADAAPRLREGKTLIISIGRRADPLLQFQYLLPVNSWSFQQTSFLRGDSGAVAPAKSPMSDLSFAGFNVSYHYDAHLPYAAIEAGEHRYRFQDYGDSKNSGDSKDGEAAFPNLQKELLNTDFDTLLTTDQAGQLPLVATGRYHAGHVIIFAANLYDPSLTKWPQYGAFIKHLLPTETKPVNVESSADAISKLKLNIPVAQARSADDLKRTIHIDVNNPTDQPIHAILAWKICNAEHVLLSSQTRPITVAANQASAIDLPERAAQLGDASITASGDAADYRIVDAGLCPTDYGDVAVMAHGMIDVHAPVTLGILTPDYRTFDDLESFPDRQMGRGYDLSGAAPIDRVVYATGGTATFNITLANAHHDIAPLAVASDVDHADNPSAQGLNDLSFSQGNIRGLWPLFGGWYSIAAPQQHVRLQFGAPVTIASSEIDGYSKVRQWSQSNPANFDITAHSNNSDVTLASVKDAAYTACMHRDEFKPSQADVCDLLIKDITLPPRKDPGSVGDTVSNCSIQEWQLYGWPDTSTPPAASGHLVVTATDLTSGKSQQLLDEAQTLNPFTELTRQAILPAHAEEGVVRIDAKFTPASGTPLTASTSIMFTAPTRSQLAKTPKDSTGLLCASGMAQIDPFGTGTSKATDGWTGPDNGVWAVEHNLMEEGSGSTDDPRRMFTTAMRFSHYTGPWHDYPSGQYYFDDVTTHLLNWLDGKWKGATYVRLFLADRWNGIPIGANFTWDDFIRFDQYLRANGGKGLTGRTRKTLSAEIKEKYADKFQVFELNLYADKLLEAQKKFADKGLDFSVTTHGSFPLAGGEIGQKLAKTHRHSGTDVFWELRGEDLYGTLGGRFGVIAANPDLVSGMYNEWGWGSGILNNIHWFGYVGTSEVARRQWYATYFVGRVNSAGQFAPLTMSGADSQGSVGPKEMDNDWQSYYRTQQIMTKLRPDAPAGMGLVVSWHEQMRHMGPVAADLGFGYYVSAGYENVDKLGGYAYAKLIKAGVPVSFVASTDTLKNWKSRQPLIVVDGLSYDAGEIDELQRLHAAGTPIIAIGGGDEASPEALKFFGLKKDGSTITGIDGAKATAVDGQTIAYSSGDQSNPIVACPTAATALLDTQAAALSKLINQSLQLSPGVAATTFVSGGQLYLSLSDQGDVNRTIDVSVRPEQLAMGRTFTRPKVIDIDRAVEIPATIENSRLSFSLPCSATDGRMIEITADPTTSPVTMIP